MMSIIHTSYEFYCIFKYYLLILCLYLYFLRNFNNLYKTLAREKGVPYRFGAVIEYFIVYWPLVIVTAIFTLVYKFIAKTMLNFHYGKENIHFLNGQNSLYVDKHPQQAVVTILLLVKDNNFGRFSSEHFYNNLRLHLCRSILNSNKIIGTIESWNGYHYIRKASSNSIRNNITKLRALPNEKYIQRDHLLKLIDEYYVDSQTNKALWRIFIGTQPVLWRDAQDCMPYPVVVQFSHCFFDEANFMKTLLRLFGDNEHTHTSSPVTPTSMIWPIVYSPYKIVNEAYQFCKCSYKSLPLAIVNSDLLQFKRNVLVGAELGHNKFFCAPRDDAALTLKTDSMFGNQFNFITNLSCILETAIIASLSEFYRNYSYANPRKEQNLIYVTTVLENFNCLTQEEAEEILSGICEPFINEVRFMCLNSPILESVSLEKPDDLVSLLEHISSLKEFLRKYKEPEITQNISSGVYNVFPKFLKKLILSHQISPQTILSQLRGPSSEIKFKDLVVQDIYGWCPNFGKTGLTFSICSYKDVPRVTLNADANLIGSKADAQALLDGVYKYFDILITYNIDPNPL